MGLNGETQRGSRKVREIFSSPFRLPARLSSCQQESGLEANLSQVLEIRQNFEAACAALRPDLHRFCTRMTGSVSDGEDLLQETLVHAFYHLPELREGASLRPWLFRIAHNRC